MTKRVAPGSSPAWAAPRAARAARPDLAARTTFCWLPPESVRAGAAGPPARMAKRAMRSRANVARGARVRARDRAGTAPGRHRAGPGSRRWSWPDEPGRRAVGRDVGEPGPPARRNGGVGHVGPVDPHGAPRGRTSPPIASASSAWPLPSTAGDPQDLAGPDREASRHAAARHPRDRERPGRRPRGARARGRRDSPAGHELAADHEPGQGPRGWRRPPPRAGHGSVAQHHDLVRRPPAPRRACG